MRRLCLTTLPVLLCSLLLFAPSGPGQAGDNESVLSRKRCNITQLVLADCPNFVTASFDDGKHQWSLSMAGPIALYKKLETYKQRPASVFIRDYDQFAAGKPRMLDTAKAWFLYEAEGDPLVCQQPCIYAFKTKDAAQTAQRELGGELLQWEAVAKRAKEYAADWDPHGRHGGRI